MSEYIWEPAKITEVDVGFEDHGIFTLFATFDYGGTRQGLGYGVNQEFIENFIKACGVDTLNRCKSRVVMVEHSHGKVVGIRPMKFEKGKPFNIRDWSTKVEASVNGRQND